MSSSPLWKVSEHFATAVHSFVGSGEHQVSLQVGSLVRIEEQCEGWYRGVVVSSGQKGLFPAAYVHLKTNDLDLLVNELAQVLREWHILLKKQYMERRTSEYVAMRDRMTVLLEWYYKVMSAGTTETRRKELKDKAIAKVEEGRRQMGLDTIMRTATGEPATEKNTGIIALYRMHQELAASDLKESSSHSNSSTSAAAMSARAFGKSHGSTVLSNSHFLFDLKILMCSVGEPTEVLFSIFNASNNQFITGDFRVLLSGQGMPYDVNAIGKLKTIFAEVISKDSNNLFLVCRLIRKGKMNLEGKKDKKNPIEYRRPFGCAVLPLDDSVITQISSSKETEFTIPIYSPVQEAQFSILHELIIRKNSQSYQPVPLAKGICIGLSALHGDINQLSTNPEFKSISITNRLGFPETLVPGMMRNDFYLTLEEGDFSQDRKTVAKNIEITVQVRRDDTGEAIKDCISIGSEDKGKPEHRSYILYHTNSPHWKETIRLTIPLELIGQAHIFFNVRHSSTSESKEKPGFSNAYLKISNPDDTIIQDGLHSLECFKPPKSSNDPVFYLNGGDSGAKISARKGDVLKVRTTLASTKLSQNSSTLSVLRWQTYPGNLAEILNNFTYVEQLDIIKFLQEIFDALFAILETKQNIAIPVYNAIVFTIGLVVDEKKRYTNFRPILDSYIRNQFSGILAHKHLMSCLKHYFDEIESNPANISKILPSLKSLEYVFKFIIASRLLFNKKQATKEDVWFKKDLLDVFKGFEHLMEKKTGEFRGAQTLALKNFSSMFQDLSEIFDVKELASIASKFIQSVHFSQSLKYLNTEKLLLIRKLVDSDLFLQEDARLILLPAILEQLKQHINYSYHDDIQQCTFILSVIIDSIQTKIKTSVGDSIYPLASMLPSLLPAHDALRMVPDVRLDLIACVLSILYLMEPHHFQDYIKEHPNEEFHFLLSITKILTVFISTRTFPENWFVLCMFQYKVVKKVIEALAKVLKVKANMFPDSPEMQLWKEFFTLTHSFLRASALSLENFPESKQKLIKENSGDMRIEVIQILKQMWTAFDGAQIHLLQPNVRPFLQLLLINQQDIRTIAMDLFFSLLQREFKEEKSLARVETETVDTIDLLCSIDPSSHFLQSVLIKGLEEKFRNAPEDLKRKGDMFLKDIKLLLSKLMVLSQIPEGEIYEDERNMATLELMTYLKETRRETTYIKYIHQLCDSHITAGNFGEAGLALLLHGNLLAWTDQVLPEHMDFKAQPSRERKEQIIKTAIDYLDKGKLWEKAIDLICELRIQYETVTFEYYKLADILQFEASLFRKITSAERFFSMYFHVGFYGKGFGTLANKKFIYRGFELERISDFTSRVTTKYPEATLLTFTESPGPEITNSPGQHLQIFNVKPSSMKDLEGSDSKIPSSVQKYSFETDINVFLYSRPFKKNKNSPGNEFRNLWVCNMYYITEDRFPTIHRRSEIIKYQELEISPIDNAINAIKAKNQELLEIITKHESGKEENISPFTMVLKGVLDAAVSGGISVYREAFFGPDYLAASPEKKPAVVQMRRHLEEQVEILENGLKIHERLCPEELGLLQEQLNNNFIRLQEQLKTY